ncbi:hypothetical protein M1P56_35015 (plasmid) [Streptomyces sp. HU2014]|uniref:hypothetical protein n=1 Tax=Streptomyces sp. HU2014 TaxID=2939414 RepID=UPI00200D5746|nr:hypothetical protein [Streptomyces sp. HU2014]UQI49730.1 hypothetical protein M1P56_35015 [Streptomyces sp. HU2014]
MANTPDLTLPITAYRLSGDDLAQVGKAKNVLVQQCMKGLGFSNFKPAAAQLTSTSSADLHELDDLRYGTYDAKQATKNGYKPDFASSGRNVFADPPAEPERTDEEWLALTGTTKAPSDGQQSSRGKAKLKNGLVAPENGCLGISAVKLSGGQQVVPEIVQRLNGESYRKSMKDPRVAKAFDQWSACMRTKGYSYTDPMQANDDPRFSSASASEAEIATAKADVTCKAQADVIAIWHSAEVDIQNKLIKENQESLTEVEKNKKALLVSAAATLSKS